MENKKNNGTLVGIVIGVILTLLVVGCLFATGTFGLNTTKTINNEKKSENTTTEPNSTDSNQTVENDNNNTSSSNDSNSNKNTTIVNQKSSVSKSQILSYYKERLSTNNENQYSVIDINNDNIPELFIYIKGTIGNQIIADTSIYTYDENKGDESNNYIVGIGSIIGRLDNNTILSKMNDGRLLAVFGHMGYETTTYYKLENDWLIRTEFSSRKTDNYKSGDVEINFKPCSDTSLIDNFK